MKKHKYSWRECIKNYRFHSIFLKNLTLIFGVILLPFICIIGIAIFAYSELQVSEEKAYTEELITRISMDLETLFNEIRDKAILVSFDSDVEMFVRADTLGEDNFYNLKDINYLITSFHVSNDLIDNIYIYANYSKGVISRAGRFTYEAFADQACIDEWQETDEKYQIIYLNRDYLGEKKETLSFYYTMKYSLTRNGAVIINLDRKRLAKELDYGENVEIMLIGKEQILYDSTGEYNGMEAGRVEMQKGSKHELVVHKKLEQFGLELVLYVDSAPLYTKLGTIRTFLLIFIGIMLLITILLVFYISRKVFDPVSDILNMLEENPGMDEEKILKNKNEVSYIRDAIYATISRNKDIEEELLVRIKLLKKAQAVALQAQINPHFINNTLEAINWMAIGQMSGDNDVSQMLNSLSQIMRFSLEDSDTFVTLQKELEYVKMYLFIQQKRLNDSFDVVWNIPKELLACKVIKMVLQPVIENAINYGIKPYDDRGELVIEAIRKQDVIYISVKDSGLGLTQEEADEINQSIRKQVIKESDHIGLSNVNQRIILAFGEEYGVKVKSKRNEGTTVELVVPYQV